MYNELQTKSLNSSQLLNCNSKPMLTLSALEYKTIIGILNTL